MPRALLVGALALCLPGAIAWAADEAPSAPKPQALIAPPRMISDHDVRVRIRGVPSGGGLARDAFAGWLRDHGAPFDRDPASFATLGGAPMTVLLNRTSLAFQRADTNRDGKVSGSELASLLLSAQVGEHLVSRG